MNLEKSTANFPLPKNQTDTIVADGQNFTNTVEGVDAQAQAFKMVLRHIYDGKPHPTTSNPNYDSTAYTRIGNTVNGVHFRQGKPVDIVQAVIAPGKTYTVTAEGIAVNGQQYHYVYVFDRQ